MTLPIRPPSRRSRLYGTPRHSSPTRLHRRFDASRRLQPRYQKHQVGAYGHTRQKAKRSSQLTDLPLPIGCQ